MNVSEIICRTGILPVLNVRDPALAEPLAQTLLQAGIQAIELLLRNENALSILSAMKKNHPEMAVGAGTVLTLEQAQQAVAAGADFLVCPGYVSHIVDWCIGHNVPIVPGCTTAAEIQTAYAAGLRTVKFFPSELLGGVAILRQYASVFSGMKFIPTNGITMENIGSYLAEPSVAACGGSFMAPAKVLNAGDFSQVRALCARAISISLNLSVAHIGINAADEADALETAKALCALLQLPCIPKDRSIFAGDVVEVMKQPGRGSRGHIGLRTSNVDRAVAFLHAKGVDFAQETAGYGPDGSLQYIYLEKEIAGFAIHLVK